MKDFIYQNYGIKIKKIFNNYFFSGDDKILILKTNKDEKYINELVKITNILYNNNIFINTFIMNKEKKFYTKKDDDYIVLLKVNDRLNEIIYDDIVCYYNIPSNLEENIIKEKWIIEIDNFEELVKDNRENAIINSSYNYFIGLCENAIQLMNEYKHESSTLSHNIKFKLYIKSEFNNPFNLIKTNYTYDIANYIKYNYFNNTINYDELYNILKEIKNKNDQIFLFACLLYTNYYIEEVNYILDGNKDDNLSIIINRIDNYKELLIYCANIFKNNEKISSIIWLFD